MPWPRDTVRLKSHRAFSAWSIVPVGDQIQIQTKITYQLCILSLGRLFGRWAVLDFPRDSCPRLSFLCLLAMFAVVRPRPPRVYAKTPWNVVAALFVVHRDPPPDWTWKHQVSSPQLQIIHIRLLLIFSWLSLGLNLVLLPHYKTTGDTKVTLVTCESLVMMFKVQGQHFAVKTAVKDRCLATN